MNIQKTSDRFHTAYCKRTRAGNVTTFTEMSNVPEQPCTVKLSKTEYMNTATGEICEYKQSSDRSENTDSLRKTFRKIRDLVNANCTTPDNIHWVTLTYAENMTDTKQLYSDFDKFLKRFKYWCKKNNRTAPEYIAVIEPQARGAWHIHLILIWDSKRPYIANNAVFAPMWGHGFTKIKGCPNADNLGAYLSAYLGDIPLSEFTGDRSIATIKNVGGKKFVKGGRLRLYPCGMNIVRHSRGVKQPVSEVIPVDDVEKEKVNSGKLTFSRSLVLSDDTAGSGKPSTLYIRHSYYNSKRPASQAQRLIQSALALGISVSVDNVTTT